MKDGSKTKKQLIQELAALRQRVAELEASEAKHRQSEQRTRQITSSLREAVWLRDTKTLEVLYVNPAYETIWGRTCQSLYENPTSFVDAILPEDKERVMEAMKNNPSYFTDLGRVHLMLAERAAMTKEAEDKECNCKGGGKPKPGSKPGKGSEGESQAKGEGQGQQGTSGGGSKGTDSDTVKRLHRGGPTSPWSQLRDRERDPVFNAIKEKYPARYQQLIEQYYKSFSDESDG